MAPQRQHQPFRISLATATEHGILHPGICQDSGKVDPACALGAGAAGRACKWRKYPPTL